jgi:hypothetical protein
MAREVIERFNECAAPGSPDIKELLHALLGVMENESPRKIPRNGVPELVESKLTPIFIEPCPMPTANYLFGTRTTTIVVMERTHEALLCHVLEKDLQSGTGERISRYHVFPVRTSQ